MIVAETRMHDTRDLLTGLHVPIVMDPLDEGGCAVPNSRNSYFNTHTETPSYG